MIRFARNLFVVASAAGALWPLSAGPVFASDSPFQDYLRYSQIVNSEVDPAELSAHLKPDFRTKFDAKTAEEKSQYRAGLRLMFNFKDIKLRSQSKNGNQATVIVDCQGLDSEGPAAKSTLRPFVNVVTMTKYGDTWVTTNVDIKRPQEAAAAGITDAQNMNQDKVWCAAIHKMTNPNKPLSGLLQGSPFTLERADFNSFSGHDSISLHINNSARFQNLTIFISLDSKPKQAAGPINYAEGAGVQQVQFSGKIDGKEMALFFDQRTGLAVSMQRLPLKDGMYPFYLMMRLPDNKHSELKGYFYAKSL